MADEEGVVEGPGSDMTLTVVESVGVISTADHTLPTHAPLPDSDNFLPTHGFSPPLFVP